MRVLLPFRNLPANNQSSLSGEEDLQESDSGSDSENEQLSTQCATSDSSGVEVSATPIKGIESSTIELNPERHTLHRPKDPPPAHSIGKTTGLDVTTDSERIKSSPPRKRPRPQPTDGNHSHKRPALDKKPAPQEPIDRLKMAIGGPSSRRTSASTSPSSDVWLFRSDNDSLRSPEETMAREEPVFENDPASARGDAGREDHASNFNFAVALKKRGLEIREQAGDGNCLFRAVSLQVYGDPSMHGDVRKQCMDFMERDTEHFSQFVTGEPFAEYVQRKRQDGVHGNNPEIQAISELFNRPIEVFSPSEGATPLNIFHAEYKTDDAPIRLSYHDGNHYNAVIDPLVPTAGLGLGLPGLQPGLADKMQVAKAVAESDAAADQMELKKVMKDSENDELQRAIKESKLSTEHRRSHEALTLSDMDATYFELEQAALEHSLASYSNYEQGRKQEATTSRRRGRPGKVDAPSAKAESDHDTNEPICAVASLPTTSSNVSQEASLPQQVAAKAAAVPSVASVASAAPATVDNDAASKSIRPVLSPGEYPQAVQELVMNGFELQKVLRARELIGENFDDLLAFLMSNTG